MRFIRPIEVTPAKLISSNVLENDYPEWAAGTNALGVRKMLAAEHKVYEVIAATTTDAPQAGLLKDPPTWMEIGYTNRWRMFDEIVGTTTSNPGIVSVTIKPGTVVNSLALFNVQGGSVTVTVTDPVEGEIYTRTVSLVDAGVNNWFDWFFADIEVRTSLVFLDMPAYGTANITITVTSSTTASVGALVIGKLIPIGTTTYGAKVGIDDYSTKERDKFGNLVVLEGAYSDTGDFPVVVETARVTKIRKMLIEVRAKPVVWIGEETYEATIIYGFFKSFDLIYSGPDVSDCQLSIEGLI
ncbi:MAG TPA: hypothetical protein VF682_25930 [Pseudomonas sp.]|jgi:hypothetical protein